MKSFFTILFSLLLAGISRAGEYFPVEVVKQPNVKWYFQRVLAYPTETGIRVKGRLSADYRHGLPKGHVDIAVFSRSGELLTATTADHIPSILTYRIKKKGGVRFSADLNKKLPSDSIVKVAYHSENEAPRINPSHDENIAL